MTQDPGRALITGKCADAGSVLMQQFRGLAARAPHFANGSAANLAEVVDFYNRRFCKLPEFALAGILLLGNRVDKDIWSENGSCW